MIVEEGRGKTLDFDAGVRATLLALEWTEGDVAALFDRSLGHERSMHVFAEWKERFARKEAARG